MKWLHPISAVILAGSCMLGCNKNKPNEPVTITFKLTASIAEGVSGFPTTGTYTCPQNDTTEYGYRLLPEFTNLAVLLDGQRVADEGSFIMNKDRLLQATCDRKILWRYPTPSSVYYDSPAVGDDGTVYFGTGLFSTDQGWAAGSVYAMNPDGSVKWSVNLGQPAYSPAIDQNGNIYVTDPKYIVHALSPQGNVLWTFVDYDDPNFYKRDMEQRTPAIAADGTIYVGGDGLYALDPATGNKRWHVSHQRFPSRECMASPVIAQDGTIYVVIGEDTLYAVNPNGKRKWTFGFDHEDEMSFADPSIDTDGTIYIPTERFGGGCVYAINPNGSLKWKYKVDGQRPVRTTITIGGDGTLYLASKAGGVEGTAYCFALSPQGTNLWHFVIERQHVTGDDAYSTPSIGSDGLIYFGAETGYLYALNPNGTLNWKHEVASGVNWSSPAIITDGTLYIGGMGYGGDYPGMFNAVLTTSHGYAVSPWPRFRHDNKNTGRFGA